MFFYPIFFLLAHTNFYTNHTAFLSVAVADNKFYSATSSGLVVFDIKTSQIIKHYTYFDGLPSNYCNALTLDKENNLWIGTTFGGLVYFKREKERFIQYPKERVPDKITINQLQFVNDTLFLATNDGLYIIDTKGTFSDFDDDKLLLLRYPTLLSNTVYTIGVFNDFWIGTNRGVTKISRDFSQVARFPSPMGDTCKAIIFVKDTVYIFTERGIGYFKNNQFLPYFFFDRPLPVFDLKWQDGSFFLATNNSFLKLHNRAIDTLIMEKTVGIVCHNGVWGLCQFWLPTLGGFLCYLKDTLLNFIFLPAIFSKVVFSAVSDNEGRVYLAHYFTFWGVKTISVINPDKTISHISVPVINPRLLAIDSRNRIWIGHWALDGGLTCYDPINRTFERYRWGEISHKNVIGALGIDENDTKWMRNQYNIIALDSFGNSFEFNPPGLGGMSKSGFAFDKKNNVYLGTLQGLLVLNHKNTLGNSADDEIRYITEGLSSPVINSVCVDYKDRVWVATPNGAGRLFKNRFEVFTTQNSGILSNEVYLVKADKYNRIWFVTKEGISLFYPEKNSWRVLNQYFLPNFQGLASFYHELFIDDIREEVLLAVEEGLIRFKYPSEPLPLFIPKVYPNPLLIENENKEYEVRIEDVPKNSKIRVYDLKGKFITEAAAKNSFYSFKIKNWASGLYFILIETDKEKVVSRFVVIN